MTAPIWQALGEAPNPITGNCGPTDNDWCGTQLVNPQGVVLVDNPDPVRGPPKMFKYTVNYHDGQFTNAGGITYSDQRACTSTPGRLIARAKTEWWLRWFMLVDDSWIGRFPKQDQLQDWINDPVNGAALDGGSGVQFHHGYDDHRTEQGSAPMYTGMDDKGPWCKLIGLQPDGSTVEKKRFVKQPLQRNHAYEWLLHTVHDTDPANGLIELWVDGEPIATGFRGATMYPGTFNYLIACLYRRWSIGSPTYQDGSPLVWTADAKPGVKYPALFTPKKGARVYDDSGMPQSHYIGGLCVGAARDAVMNLYPTIRGGNVAPTPPAPPANPAAPEWLWKDVAGGLAAQVAAADAEVKAATDRRDALVKTRDLLAGHLNKGDAWLAP